MGEREVCPTGSPPHHSEVFAQLLPSWDFPLPLNFKFHAYPSPPSPTYVFSFLV